MAQGDKRMGSSLPTPVISVNSQPNLENTPKLVNETVKRSWQKLDGKRLLPPEVRKRGLLLRQDWQHYCADGRGIVAQLDIQESSIWTRHTQTGIHEAFRDGDGVSEL